LGRDSSLALKKPPHSPVVECVQAKTNMSD
jgi:uncharacterized protein YecT (DUF1311 family)